MKTPIIALLLILFTRIGYSKASAEITIKIADAKNAPVESANIGLFKSPDSTLLKIAFSEKQGIFSFSTIPYGHYYVTVNTVNFMPSSSARFAVTPDSPRFNLGTIKWEIRNFKDIQSTLPFKRDTRVFNIAFVYRFGMSARPKPASAKPTDEQERVKLN
jgi:hypothetical protein